MTLSELFVACLISGVFVPLPEDVPLMVGGLAVSRGELPLFGVALVGFTATLLRDSFLYGLGRSAGPRVHTLLARVFGARLARAVERFESRSQRQQDGLVFLTRFAPGMRGPLYLVAGLLDVPARRFLALDAIGLLVHIPLVLAIGYYFGQSATDAMTSVLAHQRPFLAGLVVVGMVWWLARRRQRRHAREG